MKQILFLAIVMISSVAFAQDKTVSDEDQVKAAIDKAYVQGIHNGGPVDDIRAGFHPSFVMFAVSNNEVKQTPIEEWITNIEKNRSTARTNGAKAAAKFVTVSVVGTSANAQLELYRDNKKIFTDNLLLYKFPEGWRIVSKTFFRHP
jgi:hypothetical protein